MHTAWTSWSCHALLKYIVIKEILLSKLTRASNLLHEIIKTRSWDAEGKNQRARQGLISLARLQQIYPSCIWIARQVATTKQELLALEKHGSMDSSRGQNHKGILPIQGGETL